MRLSQYLIFVCLFFLSSCMSAANDENLLASLKWEKRIIIAHLTQDNVKKVERYHVDITDRDIIWFLIKDKTVNSNLALPLPAHGITALKNRYLTNKTGAVLIGKDGFMKKKQRQLNFPTLFALIDTMPMRIQEMRNSTNNDDG